MNTVPEENEQFRAKVIMEPNPYTLSTVSTVGDIGDALTAGFSVFPLLNKSKQLVGMISSNFLIVLLRNK